MFDNQYRTKMINRTAQRIKQMKECLSEVRPARQMPAEEQVILGAGRQMNVATLFLDINGYSSWPNYFHGEQTHVLVVMNLFMTEMMSIVKDHDGEFEKNTGDGLMAYFGTDTTSAQVSVMDAVNAAITMHYFNDHILSSYLIRAYGIKPIEFRIGIDYGPITVAKVGIYGCNSLVAIGTSANVACKLLKIAAPGEIIIGSHVKDNLPIGYQQFCEISLPSTGFYYIGSGIPYFAYKYKGRWKHPAS